jgi:hypothetical protein
MYPALLDVGSTCHWLGQRTRFKLQKPSEARSLSASNRSYAGSSSGSRSVPIGSTRTRELILSMVTSAPCSSASRLK